jgi:raffinose/stachyose/melibiose transport system permease protein
MRDRVRDELASLTFLLPAAVLFLVFVLLPFFQGVPMAFFRWDGFSKQRTWAGIENFVTMAKDKAFLSSLTRTIEFTFYMVLFSNLFGLVFALLIHAKSRFHTALRTVFFMPFVISLVLSAFIWSYLYSDVLYRFFHIPSPLGSTRWVILGLAVIAVWRCAGYCMVIYIAALQSVPHDFYEASRIEGAGRVRTFFSITVPMIMPAFTANVTLLLAWGLKVFDSPMAATGGGPGRSSETIALYVYSNIFNYYKAGYGQAVALVFTLFIFFASALLTRTMRRWEVDL